MFLWNTQKKIINEIESFFKTLLYFFFFFLSDTRNRKFIDLRFGNHKFLFLSKICSSKEKILWKNIRIFL